MITTYTLQVVCYALIYLIYSFIQWDLVNPFLWIVKLPTYTPEGRFLILFFFVLAQVCYHLIVADYLKFVDKSKK